MRIVFPLLVIVPLLAGCYRFSLETLQRVNLDGKEFPIALAREYRALSQKEASLYDWIDAEHFARKGLKAVAGKEVLPEHPKYWDLSSKDTKTLNHARKELLAAVTDKVKQQMPDKAAQATAMFDCWVEEQEEKWQEKDINSCRTAFFEAINQLSVSSEAMKNDIIQSPAQITPEVQTDNMIASSSEKEEPTTAILPKESIRQETSYFVLFEFDSSEIVNGENRVIEEAYQSIKDRDKYNVILNGYTDRAGPEGYNLRLSRKRAEIVRDALVKKGMDKTSIELYGFGESYAGRPIADGKRDPASRRVEIVIR